LDLAPQGLAAARHAMLLTDGSRATRSQGTDINVEPFTAYIEKLTN
jgi:hypothetical protein